MAIHESRNTCVWLCHHQLPRRGGYLRTANVYKCIHSQLPIRFATCKL